MAASTMSLRSGVHGARGSFGCFKETVLSPGADNVSLASLQPPRLSVPGGRALSRKGKGHVQAKVKRKAEGVAPAERADRGAFEAPRMPWVAVAAATALVTLGASDQATYGATISPVDQTSAPTEATGNDAHLLSASSLSAPFLVSGNDAEVLLYSPIEPLHNVFNPDDFRAKLPDGAGPLGGGHHNGGEWFFSSLRSRSRACPAWGSNQNIEMVVPGAAKPLQPPSARGHKRWLASLPGVDASQLQESQEQLEARDEGKGSWQYLEVADAEEGEKKSGAPEEGKKNPLEGLIIEIVRMPVFSCYSL